MQPATVHPRLKVTLCRAAGSPWRDPGRAQGMATSQGERRCNYRAITLMMLSESCCGIIEAGGEQKVAATAGRNA